MHGVIRVLVALVCLVSLVSLTSCGSTRALPPPPPLEVDAHDVETPKSAAEQAVLDARTKAEKVRKDGGSTVDVLEADRALSKARARLAREQASAWEADVKAKDTEIREERDRRRQEFLYWFSGVCGLLAIIAGVGAFVWPTTRRLLAPLGTLLGVLCPVALFAAWLVPYLWIIAIVIGLILLGAGAWYLSDNERHHRLKDKTTDQVLMAVNRAKEEVPEFRAQYKDIFRQEIDADADSHIDDRRRRLAQLEALEAARVAHLQAA